MRRLTLWIVSTVAALVLLLSYRTSFGATGAPPPAPMLQAPPGPAATGPAATGPATAPAGRAVTVAGPPARTRYGPVQVEVQLQGRTIVDVRALRWPDANDRDAEISAAALPQLRSEVLTAQSARIDTVSGATYTSDGYRRSLQGALDQAHVR